MKNLILKLGIGLSILLGLSMTVPVYAAAPPFNPLDAACNGVKGSSVCAQGKSQQANPDSNPAVNLIAKAGRIISIAVGLTAVIMIIVSGFTLVVAGSSSEEVTKAKNRIVNSVIGLIVASLAWSITTYVINHLA